MRLKNTRFPIEIFRSSSFIFSAVSSDQDTPNQVTPNQVKDARTETIPFEHEPDAHPRYNLVHKMVLHGDPTERIMKRLEVNKIRGAEAKLLYSHARKHRIKIIQKEFSKKIGIGLGLILSAIGIYSYFWFKLGFITRNLDFITIVIVIVGVYFLGRGIGGCISAGSREGSVLDES